MSKSSHEAASTSSAFPKPPTASASCCDSSSFGGGFEFEFEFGDGPSESTYATSSHYLKAQSKKGKWRAGDEYDSKKDHMAMSAAATTTKVAFSVSVMEGVVKPSETPLLGAQPEDEDVHEMNADTPIPASKFADRLNTNYTPSFLEISEIAQYVSAVDTKLAAYDAEIAKLTAALHHLTAKRTHLHDTRTAHRALASPFRRLPPEILQVIFVWCLPHTRNCVMHASEPPVLLGRVCSEWRRIVLATPELWASLHIVPPNVSYTNPAASRARFQRKRELVETWLRRAGACPLSVSMVWFARDSDEEAALCGMLLEALAPLSARWRALDFQLPLRMFAPFARLRPADVPLLESITLMDNRTPLSADIIGRWPDALAFAEGAVRLHTFTLTFFSGGMRLPAMVWPQLTTLCLESNIAFFFADARDLLDTLGQCVALVSCTLKFPLSHTAVLPAYAPLDITVVLPSLETLCVDGDQHLPNTFHMNSTLAAICAPRLRTLEVMGRAGRPESVAVPEPFAAMRTMLRKSRSPPLERMSLESLTIVADEFIGCLGLVPTLRELMVQNWTARLFTAVLASGDEAAEGGEGNPGSEDELADVADNKVLLALTVRAQDDHAAHRKTAEECDGEQETTSGADPTAKNAPALPLCPNLERVDLTMCEASQRLFCDFVASRWDDPPPEVTRLHAVKSNFMSVEEGSAKARMARFSAEGLDVSLSYQTPVSDEYNPSPWTGLEGVPGSV